MTYKLGGVPTQKAIWFDGSADRAYYTPGSSGIANLSPQPNEAWSVFLWGKNCSTSSHKVFCGQRNTASPYGGWDFGVNPATSTANSLYVDLHSDVSGLRTITVASGAGFSTPLNAVGWYHIGFTYDGTGNASGCKIYCNGQLVPTTNTLSSGTAGEFAGGTMAVMPLCLADLANGPWSFEQEYTACQFAVYSGALSATQVQDIYSGTGERPGPCDLRNKLGGAAGITLVGYWLYGNDSDSITTLQDGTSNNFDLTGSSLLDGQLLTVKI